MAVQVQHPYPHLENLGARGVEAAFPASVRLWAPTFLTFLATGELLGLPIGDDWILWVSLKDDLEHILQLDKIFGLLRNSL